MNVQDMYLDLELDIKRFALSISRHEQEADDLIQHSFEKALSQPDMTSWARHKQKAWFYRVMKNALIDERRKYQREQEWEDTYEPVFSPIGLSSLEMTELLSKLPKVQSDIVFKRYWIGLSSKEIGQQTGLTASTIRYHLAQAINTLRMYLEEEL
ncbi:RNA polymerase sigma factor [Alkalicoccobacillus porphyridii]|uniref:RNA polymerase sigma factor n=1 Tax=Alkalicoccobacillus porphyridii TaxID=2597270 RepID=A0A554A2J0_9BACI|nr:RNA polymerase sigma factor [Alkalicoccobacillus porphyridii]TSB47909.1 RNA polymerase sigma factor [Alkalicoccobacillus porphyridii]